MISDFIAKFQSLSAFLIDVDRNLFHKINQEWTNSFFDKLMPWITSYEETRWIIFALVIYIAIKLKKRAIVVIAGCALSILVADVTAARVVKPLVHRERPEFSQSTPKLLVPSQSSWSFPSNHAANMFAVATFMGLTITGTGPFVMLIATLVAYSRVYVGVHYPLDAIGGGILGFLSGLLIYYFFSGIENFIYPKALARLPKKWRKKDYITQRRPSS